MVREQLPRFVPPTLARTARSPQQRFDRVLAYIEEQADAEDEPPGDWMVMRLVVNHEDDTVTHEWLPQQE